MTATVHLPALLRDLAAGASHVEVKGSTVRAVLAALDERYPGMAVRVLDEHGGLLGHVLVFVDGEDVRQGAGLDAAVPDGAHVTVQQAMSGG